MPDPTNKPDIGFLIAHLPQVDNRLYQALVRLQDAIVIPSGNKDVNVQIAHAIKTFWDNSYVRVLNEVLGDAPSVLNWFKTDKDRKAAFNRETVDCTQYFQAAIDSMYAAGGGTVFIPPGTYTLGTTGSSSPGITMRSGVSLKGHSFLASRLVYIGDGPGILLDSTESCTICDLSLTCTSSADTVDGILIQNTTSNSFRNKFRDLRIYGTRTFADGPSGTIVSMNNDGLVTPGADAYAAGLRDGMITTIQGTDRPANNGLSAACVIDRDLVTGVPTGKFYTAGLAATGGTWTSKYSVLHGTGIHFYDNTFDAMYFNVVEACHVVLFKYGIVLEGTNTFFTPNANFINACETSACEEHLVFRKFVGNCGVNGHFCNGSGLLYPKQTGLVMGDGTSSAGAYNCHLLGIHCDIGPYSQSYQLYNNANQNFITIDDECGVPSVDAGRQNNIMLTQGVKSQFSASKIKMDVNASQPGSAFNTVNLYMRRSPEQSTDLVEIYSDREYLDGSPQQLVKLTDQGELVFSGLNQRSSLWTSTQGVGWLGAALPRNFDDVMLGYNLKFVAGQYDPDSVTYGDDMYRQRQPNWAGGYAGMKLGSGGSIKFFADDATTSESTGSITSITAGVVYAPAHGIPRRALITISGSSNTNFNGPVFTVKDTGYDADHFDIGVDGNSTGGTWHWGLDKPISPQPTPIVEINKQTLMVKAPSGATDRTFKVLDSSSNYIFSVDKNGVVKFRNDATLYVGSASPETVITADPGDLYIDQNGALWVKETGAGNTGWAQLLTAGSISGSYMALTGNQTAAGTKTFSTGIILGSSASLTAPNGVAGITGTITIGGLTLTVSGGIITNQSGSFSSSVTSVFGRTGAVVKSFGDYGFADISGTLSYSQMPSAVVATTITLAKITTGGTDGSIQVNAQGIITNYVKPT